MKTEVKQFAFRDKVRKLRIFGDEFVFRNHAREHFTNPDEPWSRIPGLEDIDNMRQIFSPTDVSEFERLYQLIVCVMAQGMHFALEYPLYVSYKWKVKGKPRQRKFTLLADYGYRIVCSDKAVLTALFARARRECSFRVRFRNEWHAIRARYQKKRYNDIKGGQHVEQHDVEFFTDETWATLPDYSAIESRIGKQQ